MLHSLGERFRAALLGMAIGEWLTVATPESNTPSPPTTSGMRPLHRSAGTTLALQSLPYTGYVLSGIAHLVRQRAIVPDHWAACLAPVPGAIPPGPVAVALQISPIALFLHEDDRKAVQHIQDLLTRASHAPEAIEVATLLTLILSWGLREQVHPRTLIARLLAARSSLPIAPDDRILTLLQTLQALLKSRANLHTAIQAIGQESPFMELGLALYCWLSTPQEFRLSLQRTIQPMPIANSSGPLTGMMSGLYNGIAAIPVSDRIAVSQIRVNSTSPDCTSPEECVGFNLEEKVLGEADRLWSVWCGVYEPGSSSHAASVHNAVAAPHVIRPH